MGRKKKDINVKKAVEVIKKGCGCRKRGKKCVNPNPCEECKVSNERIEKKNSFLKYAAENLGIKGDAKRIEEKKGRGRPKKIREEKNEHADSPVPIVTKASKLLGHCPKCQLSITGWDLEEGHDNRFNCPKCGCKGKNSELKEKMDLGERPKTKKDYFQSFNSSFTWHTYNSSSDINTIAKPVDPVSEPDEDVHHKSFEDSILDKHIEE